MTTFNESETAVNRAYDSLAPDAYDTCPHCKRHTAQDALIITDRPRLSGGRWTRRSTLVCRACCKVSSIYSTDEQGR